MSPQAAELLVNEVAPRLRSILPSLCPIGADDPEEQGQDAMAIAAELLRSLETRGKSVTAGNLVYYAVRLIRQGRRSTGQSKTDPMHPATQISGRSQMVSLDAALPSHADGEEDLCLHEVLACQDEDPSWTATRHLDWEMLWAKLDTRTREILNSLIHGRCLTTLVQKLNRSRSALQCDKERLACLVREHLGADILVRVQEHPLWRDNLEANLQKVACRYERQSA